MHLVDKLQTIVGLVRAVSSKNINRVSHVRNIILHSAVISVLKDLVDEIDAALRTVVNLFVEISLDRGPKSFFVLETFEIDHFVFSFQRETRTDWRNWQIVALSQLPSKRTVSSEYFDLDVISVNSTQL